MALIGYIGCDLVINRWQLGTTPTCYKPANSRLIAGCYNNTDTLNSCRATAISRLITISGIKVE